MIQSEKWVIWEGKVVPILKLERLAREELDSCREGYEIWKARDISPVRDFRLKAWLKRLIKAEERWVITYNSKWFDEAQPPPLRMKIPSTVDDESSEWEVIPAYLFEERDYSSVVEIPAFFFAEEEDVIAEVEVLSPSYISESYESLMEVFRVGSKLIEEDHSIVIFGYNRKLFDRGKNTEGGYQPEFRSKISCVSFCSISVEFLVEKKLCVKMSTRTIKFTFMLIAVIVGITIPSEEEEGNIQNFDLFIPSFFFEEKINSTETKEFNKFNRVKTAVVDDAKSENSIKSFSDRVHLQELVMAHHQQLSMGCYHSHVNFGPSLFDRGKDVTTSNCFVIISFSYGLQLVFGFIRLLVLWVVNSYDADAWEGLFNDSVGRKFFLDKIGISLGTSGFFASSIAKDSSYSTACQVGVELLHRDFMCDVNKKVIKIPLLRESSSYDCSHLNGRVIDRGKKFNFVRGLFQIVGGFVGPRFTAKSVRLLKGCQYDFSYAILLFLLLIGSVPCTAWEGFEEIFHKGTDEWMRRLQQLLKKLDKGLIIVGIVPWCVITAGNFVGKEIYFFQNTDNWLVMLQHLLKNKEEKYYCSGLSFSRRLFDPGRTFTIVCGYSVFIGHYGGGSITTTSCSFIVKVGSLIWGRYNEEFGYKLPLEQECPLKLLVDVSTVLVLVIVRVCFWVGANESTAWTDTYYWEFFQPVFSLVIMNDTTKSSSCQSRVVVNPRINQHTVELLKPFCLLFWVMQGKASEGKREVASQCRSYSRSWRWHSRHLPRRSDGWMELREVDHLKWKFRCAITCWLAHKKAVSTASRLFDVRPQGFISLGWTKLTKWLTAAEFEKIKEWLHKIAWVDSKELSGQHGKEVCQYKFLLGMFYLLCQRSLMVNCFSYNQRTNSNNLAESRECMQFWLYERLLLLLLTVTRGALKSKIMDLLRWKFKSATSSWRMARGSETVWVSTGLGKGLWGKGGWNSVGFLSLCFNTNRCYECCQSRDTAEDYGTVLVTSVGINTEWGLLPNQIFSMCFLHMFPFNAEKKRGGLALQLPDSQVHTHGKGAAEIVRSSHTEYLATYVPCKIRDESRVKYLKEAISEMAANSLHCLQLNLHKKFSFAKIWLMAAQFERRQKNLMAAENIIGNRTTTFGYARIVWKAYVDFEISEREYANTRALYGGISVRGRSPPNDKLLLVKALKKRGHAVAEFEDDTNDTPALKRGTPYETGRLP